MLERKQEKKWKEICKVCIGYEEKCTYRLWTFLVGDIFADDKIDTDFCWPGQQHSFSILGTGSWLRRTESDERNLYNPHMLSHRNGPHSTCPHTPYMEWSLSGL